MQFSDEYPPPVRLANAKQVRRAAREIARLIEQLESVPEPWVVEAVACFEALADVVIDALRDVANQHPLH